MRAVTVIGGGFSGLATAYYLSHAGFSVEILEKTGRLGGLIATVQTPHGPVETAAIGLKNTTRVEALCRDLGLPMVCSTLSPTRARYIYRDRPRRWPLSPAEYLSLATRYAAAAATGSRAPRALETVDEWGTRVLGRGATRWMLGPTLQGMYAGDPSCLSASLVLGVRGRTARAAPRGVVAPAGGMQQLIEALESHLRARDVSIRFNTPARLNGRTPTIICTSARDAAECLRDAAPAASRALSTIDMLPLVRITSFYPDGATQQTGRGVLFPPGGRVRALGALFDRNVFPTRAGQYSESWIYGGAADREVVDLSEHELGMLMDRDRQVLCGRHVTPVARVVHRWRAALPHYDLQLESTRSRGFDLPGGVYLAGNYVGGIGVSMLLEQAAAVANQLSDTAESRPEFV